MTTIRRMRPVAQSTLLILSVLLPNVVSDIRRTLVRRSLRNAPASDAMSASGGAA